MCKYNELRYTFEYDSSNVCSTVYSEVYFLSSYLVEKTLKSDQTQSVILVDSNYQIVEPVALFLEYLKKGNALNTIESYCRVLKEYFTWLKYEEMKFYEVSKRDMFSWIEYIELDAGKKQKKSARTINKYLATIGSFYNYFEGMGGYIENPIKTTQTQTNPYWKTFNVTKDQVSINFLEGKKQKRKTQKDFFKMKLIS